MKDHALPADLNGLEDNKLYAVDGLADIWDQFPNTTAVALIGKVNIGWMGQLIDLAISWALHGDGKHKLHFGRWVLMTFGTHCLHWDVKHKV